MTLSLSDEQALELVRSAIGEVVAGGAELFDDISLETKIADLAIDSIQTMEMVGVIEENLGIIFGEEELAQVVHFRDLANLMRRGVD